MTRVKDYYNTMPDKEWERLHRSDYSAIEYEVTKHFISKHLKPKSKVADIGGGPGKYTLWLLENEHKVLLSDLSSELLKKAEIEIAKSNLSQNFLGSFERNAVDLNELPESEFDLTLLLGPLYHLLSEEEREGALREAKRITMTGGLLFVATINRLCPIRDMMFGCTEEWTDDLANNYAKTIKLLEDGRYLNDTGNPAAFTDAYFAKTNDVPKLFAKLEIDLIETFSCEGIAAFLDEKVSVIRKNVKAWPNFIDLLCRTATDPSIVGSGEHTVYVGKKRGQ